MSYYVDLAPGQNPHINFEPSIHGGLVESAREQPYNPPEISGCITCGVIERCNDYIQARARYVTMMDWERDDLVKNMGDLLARCERDVQERMVWHLLLVHDDYGKRVGEAIGIRSDDIRGLAPLRGQVLTEEDRHRIRNLGSNGDKIDPSAWWKHTGSVENRQASAEQVLGGMKGM